MYRQIPYNKYRAIPYNMYLSYMHRVIIIIAAFLLAGALPCKANMDFDYLRRVYGNSHKKKEA